MPTVPEPIVNAITSVAKVFVPSTKDKAWWQSKTLWATVLVAAAGFYPPTALIITANPAVATAVVGGVFAVLRIITAGKITAS